MPTEQLRSRPASPNPKQRSVRRRAANMPIEDAIRMAVHSFFRFTHRAVDSKSLWCQRERVWMGRSSYLDWALCDAEINIPWSVSKAADAPDTADELCDLVRQELIATWNENIRELPSKSTPNWPPLP